MNKIHARSSALLVALMVLGVVLTIPCIQSAYASEATNTGLEQKVETTTIVPIEEMPSSQLTSAGDLQVGGCDYVIPSAGTGTNEGVDILTVTGKAGDTVYINLADGDETIASHLAFTLDDTNAETDANGDMVGIVSVKLNSRAFSYKNSYTIDVFADRAETEKLYRGIVSTTWAKYGNALSPIVVRTLGEKEERPFKMPSTSMYANMMYSLANDKAEEVDGLTVYTYEESKDAPASVDGYVYYFDTQSTDGAPVRTDEIGEIAKGDSREVKIPDVITGDDGSLYRTLQLSGSVTAAYPGTTEFSIMCKKLDDNWGKEGSFYNARIQYVNDKGEKLEMVDSVLVNKRYLYTPPTYIYISGKDGIVQEYKLSAANPELNAEGILELETGMAEGTKDFNIVYEKVPDDAERTWTVILENGSVSPTDPNRVIDRITYHGKPGETVTHETKQKIIVADKDENGTLIEKDYVPVTSAEKSYEHTFAVASNDIEQVIYYVPDGYIPPEAYEVKVNYVNIATNEVITSESYTASPNMRSDLEIKSPESFSYGGIEWIRLAGQEKAIRHSFYAGKRTYVVYYRDINDDLHATTVINTVNVTYTDEEGDTITRPTTTTDNGTTTNYTQDEVDGTTRYTGNTNTNTDGGTTYNDGGTTTSTTNGGTTTTNGGTTTNTTNGGNMTNNGGTTTTNGGTTTTNGRTTVTGGPATTTNAGTTTTGGGNATPAGGNANASGNAGGNAANAGTNGTATGLQTGQNMLSVSGGPEGESGNLVGSDGRDMATTRIDDDVTPLAGPGSSETAGKANNKLSSIALAGILAALAGLSALIFFVYKRRKKEDEEEPSDNNASA